MSLVTPLDPLVNAAYLKLDLYCRGMRIHESCDETGGGGRPILRTRADLGSGLELILPGNLWTNAPVTERFARSSPYELWRVAEGGDRRTRHEIRRGGVLLPEECRALVQDERLLRRFRGQERRMSLKRHAFAAMLAGRRAMFGPRHRPVTAGATTAP